MKKNKVAYLLSICFLITVVTSCSQNTESITTVTSEVSSVQQETESDNTEITELDETDFSSNQEETDDIEDLDTEWGYSMIRTYENSLLTDQQSLVIKYFDNNYFSIEGNYNYEVLKRNTFEFEGAQIEFIGTVRKVLSSAEDDFSALVWIGRTEDEFYYRSWYEEGAYERYLEETKDNMVIIQGDQLSSRVIEGDRIDGPTLIKEADYISITNKPLVAKEEELEIHNRAHSAKLRIMERK